MSVTLYGIKNCDTMKKARAWLDAHGIAYLFHDYKIAGLPPARLDAWIAAKGWEVVLNRAGTTFRGLPEADKQGLDASRARALMLAAPSLVKRPVLEAGDTITIGFRPDIYEGVFAKS